jgi:phytoene synthase
VSPSASPDTARSARGIVERIARSSGSSFYYAFLTLPRRRRDAIFAVYAFCHAVDSSVDEAPDEESARRGIEHWRRELAAAFEGRAVDPVACRLGEVASDLQLPAAPLFDVIDGVEMDVRVRRYRDWNELAGYCDLVAGAVGRVAVRVFGRDDEDADRYAITLGRALQLTNILRDLAPDAALGRFYLPQDELSRLRLDEAAVLDPGRRERLELLDLQAARARSYFAEAAEIARGAGRELCAAEVMRAIYARLLDRVVSAGYPVALPVVRVSRVEKGALALGIWLRRRFPSRAGHGLGSGRRASE